MAIRWLPWQQGIVIHLSSMHALFTLKPAHPRQQQAMIPPIPSCVVRTLVAIGKISAATLRCAADAREYQSHDSSRGSSEVLCPFKPSGNEHRWWAYLDCAGPAVYNILASGK